jgi:hypothetical protein
MSYQIPAWQRWLHIVSEAAAVLTVPLIFAAAAEAREPHKSMLQSLAVGTLVIDGFLLYQWLTQHNGYRG